MKRNRILSTALAAALLFSVGAAHLVTEVQASPDTAPLVVEDLLPAGEISAENPAAGEKTAEFKILPNPQLTDLGLGAPNSLDSNGSIPIPQDGTLLDIRLPEYLGGEVLNAIAPGAFSGTSCLRSITLPAVISTIGENAFANCPGLAYIVLEDRYDLEGMTLGGNWNGNAQVIFALIVEEVPEETEPEETEPEETEPVETEPVETEPVETEPVETEPVETEPVETEPAETDPVETESVETEPVETEPVETEPVETEPAETEPAETEPAETEPAETEPVETEPVETEPAETEPVETEPVETEPAETEPAETEPAETEPVETEPPVTEPAIPQPSEAMTGETESEESTNPEP